MNSQIARLAVVALALLGALIVATTYWQTWAAPGLADRQDNAIQRVAQFTIERGTIFAADGTTLLATNRARRSTGRRSTSAATRSAASSRTSSATRRSRARAPGSRSSLNDFLTGSNTNLEHRRSTRRSTSSRGTTIEGNDVCLTLDARGPAVALDALGRQVRRRRRARADDRRACS